MKETVFLKDIAKNIKIFLRRVIPFVLLRRNIPKPCMENYCTVGFTWKVKTKYASRLFHFLLALSFFFPDNAIESLYLLIGNNEKNCYQGCFLFGKQTECKFENELLRTKTL